MLQFLHWPLTQYIFWGCKNNLSDAFDVDLNIEALDFHFLYFLVCYVCYVMYFFSIRNFFHRHWQLTGQQEKGGEQLLFHSTTSTCSQTFRHLFATLHVRWLSHTFNRNACIYQTATRWYSPPYRLTIWLIDDVMLIFVCLPVDLILGFVTAISHEKPVDSNSYWLSSLYYKQTD